MFDTEIVFWALKFVEFWDHPTTVLRTYISVRSYSDRRGLPPMSHDKGWHLHTVAFPEGGKGKKGKKDLVLFRFHLWPGEISGGNPSRAALMEGVKINILHGSVKLKCVCNFFSSIENTNYANAFHGVFLTSTDEEGSFVHPGKKGNPCGHKGKRRDKCCDMTQNFGLAGYARNSFPPSLPRFSKILYRPNFSHFPHAFLHLFQTFIFCSAAVGIWVTLKQQQGGCLFSKPSTDLSLFCMCTIFIYTHHSFPQDLSVRTSNNCVRMRPLCGGESTVRVCCSSFPPFSSSVLRF